MAAKFGIQLYTVRDEMEKDFFGTLEKIAEIGFKHVEFHEFYDYEAKEVKEALDQLGLTAIASFARLDVLIDDQKLQHAIEYNAQIGNRFLVCPWAQYETADDYRKMAELFNEVGSKCRENGLRFCYHHHEHEFEEFDGEYGLDILLEQSDPELVFLQLDTANALVADIDPLAYMKKYEGRCPLVHLKDYVPGEVRGSIDLGSGTLELGRTIEVAEQTGAEWIVAEQEKFSRPSLESARIAFEQLQKLGRV